MDRPRLTLTPGTVHASDPVAAFAAEHIGEEDFVEIEVVYVGFESAPDILRVDRAGEVVAARSAGDVDA